MALNISSAIPTPSDGGIRMEIVQLASLPVSVASWDFQKKPSWRDVVVDGEMTSEHTRPYDVRSSERDGDFHQDPMEVRTRLWRPRFDRAYRGHR